MPRPIDADALNVAIEKWFDGVCVYDVSPFEAVNDFQSIVDEQPTISTDDLRGVGKWIPLDYSDEAYGNMYKCAKCGCSEIGNPNYCPNCGARMKGAEDGTTDC